MVVGLGISNNGNMIEKELVTFDDPDLKIDGVVPNGNFHGIYLYSQVTIILVEVGKIGGIGIRIICDTLLK